MRRRRLGFGVLLDGAAALAVAAALFLVFLVAPREAVMGDVQRVFYFHVAAAWVGYLALLVVFAAAVVYVLRGDWRWDGVALSSVEIGMVFITEGIVTGMFWAKATWGKPWVWEPRLTTSAVLWVIYAAYLLLRRAIEDPGRRARLSAVYGILGFIAVPINFMAIRWWRAVHPLVFDSGGAHLAPSMLAVLIFCAATFTVLYASLLVHRLRLEWMSEQVRHLRQHGA